MWGVHFELLYGQSIKIHRESWVMADGVALTCKTAITQVAKCNDDTLYFQVPAKGTELSPNGVHFWKNKLQLERYMMLSKVKRARIHVQVPNKDAESLYFIFFSHAHKSMTLTRQTRGTLREQNIASPFQNPFSNFSCILNDAKSAMISAQSNLATI